MKALVDIHTHNPLSGSTKVLNVRLGMECAPTEGSFSAGIHPWDIEDLHDRLEHLLKRLERASIPCIAIGEVGLDKACDTPWEMQYEVFVRQVKIAAKRQLPLIIHCVKAYNETVALLKDFTLCGVVFHGFIGSTELCQQLTSQGYYISFGFSALRSPKTIEALQNCPLDKLFLESDTEEQNIARLYIHVASIKHIDTETLVENIYNNYKNLFHNELAGEN